MWRSLGLVLFCVAVANCVPFLGFPYYHGNHGYGELPYYNRPYDGIYNYGVAPYHNGVAPYHNGVAPYNRWIYYGEFEGSCAGAPDGLYFHDQYSFVYCSNGQKTIQECAEGSANPALDYFHVGGYYRFYDFCSVNLVAQGYNGHKNYKQPQPLHHNKPVVVDKGYYGEASKKETSYQGEYSKGHKVEVSYGGKDYHQQQVEHKKPVYDEPKKVEGYKVEYHKEKVYTAPKK